MSELVTVERDGYVLLIGVNRAAKRNAFNLAALDALASAYEILGTDDELRVERQFLLVDAHRRACQQPADRPGQRDEAADHGGLSADT